MPPGEVWWLIAAKTPEPRGAMHIDDLDDLYNLMME